METFSQFVREMANLLFNFILGYQNDPKDSFVAPFV